MTPEEKRKADRTQRLERLDTWRQIYKRAYEDLDGEELIKLCHVKGILLWDDETNDDEKLKDACREANIELVEDHPDTIDPGHPIIILATEVAFNPRFTECARAIRDLREELKSVGVYSRAVLDAMK